MTHPKLDPADRDEADREDFEAALKQILLAPQGERRSENREPMREELERRYRLERRD